jgi:hypothetical protein
MADRHKSTAEQLEELSRYDSTVNAYLLMYEGSYYASYGLMLESLVLQLAQEKKAYFDSIVALSSTQMPNRILKEK